MIEKHVHILLAVVACPHTGPAEEEALVGSQTVDDPIVAGVMECLQSDVKTAVVADVLAQRLFAVHLLAVHYLDSREVVSQTGSALVEGSFVGSRPPVALVMKQFLLFLGHFSIKIYLIFLFH